MFINRLENLSNEILYEIFEYLDDCFVYDIFSNFNTRFQYLINYSSLPFKLYFFWTSKSIFDYYCKHIVISNINRIISIHIPNPLAIKLFLSLFSINISFIRVESLNFGRMNSDQIIYLLICLKSLPRRFSLSININNPKDNMNTIYQLIVILPVLKYCKISSKHGEQIFSKAILIRTKEQKESSIKYLIINGGCRFDQLDGILSYTPQLTHLSCHSLNIGNDQMTETIITTNLKKLSIDLSFQLEILRISASHEKTYLDAKQWQQLILYQIPHLRIFDFQYKSELCNDHTKFIEYDKLIEQFNSQFWFERKWFFQHQNCRGTYGPFKIFYSIHPYRRTYYQLYEHTTNNLEISSYQENSIHLCRHIIIENQWTNINCSFRFPYATKLTLNGGYAPEIPLLFNHLNHTISLANITELIVTYDYLFISKFLMLLQYMPNINSLTIPQTAIIQTHNLSEKEIEIIHTLSKKNHIKKVRIINRECTIKQLNFLFNLCSQIEYFTIDLIEYYEDLILKYLISKMKENNSRLILLCLNRWNANNDFIKKIHSIIINSEISFDNYSLELFNDNVYLWC